MSLDLDHSDDAAVDEDISNTIPLYTDLAVSSSWVGDLNREYRLYHLYPSVFDNPPVFVYTCVDKNISESTGEVKGEEDILAIGRINGRNHPVSQPLLKQLLESGFGPEKSIGEDDYPTTESVLMFEQIVFDLSANAENIVSIQEDMFSVSISKSDLEQAAEVASDLSADDITELVDILATDDSYPLSHIDDVDGVETSSNTDELTQDDVMENGNIEQNTDQNDSSIGSSDTENEDDTQEQNDIYILQSKFQLSNIVHGGVDIMPAYYDAIQDYHEGVFKDQAELALLFNVARVTDIGYDTIADLFGMSSDDLSQVLDLGSDMISRAHNTSEKYRSNGE